MNLNHPLLSALLSITPPPPPQLSATWALERPAADSASCNAFSSLSSECSTCSSASRLGDKGGREGGREGEMKVSRSGKVWVKV